MPEARREHVHLMRCHAAVQMASWTTGSRDAVTVLDSMATPIRQYWIAVYAVWEMVVVLVFSLHHDPKCGGAMWARTLAKFSLCSFQTEIK